MYFPLLSFHVILLVKYTRVESKNCLPISNKWIPKKLDDTPESMCVLCVLRSLPLRSFKVLYYYAELFDRFSSDYIVLSCFAVYVHVCT